MKILYLTDQIYLHGGVEKVLSQKANYLADMLEDEVVIVTYRQKNKKPIYPFSNKIKFVDLSVNYDITKSYFNSFNLKKVPLHFSALKQLLENLKPDIVISCNFGPDFYFLPFLERQIPKIKEFHSSRYFYLLQTTRFKSRVMHRINAFVENKYHQLVLLNDLERNFYGSDNITVIPNPAELSSANADYKSKKIMAAGRISPVKNFDDLIECFSRLSRQFPDWELHIYGEDYIGTQGKLELKIKKYGSEQQIKFKGVSADLKEKMVNYSIYAMTSETECFPMVLLESLSVGLPVISYDSPTGPQHILIDEEDSFLLPYKNLDIFTEKLRQLMENENLRMSMGRKGIKNVQRFSIEIVMQHWKDLFNSLIKEKEHTSNKNKNFR